jgi:type IV pilus assembly protein PilN
MIRINLLPAEEAQAAAGRRQELFTGVLAVLSVVLIMTLAHMWQWVRLAEATRELNRLTQELVALQGPYATVQKIEAQKRELREKLKVIGELETKRRGPVRALEDLSSATPDKLWLTEFADTGGTLKISGLGVDEQTVADFMRRLAASPYFRAVDLDETSLVDQDGVKQKKFVLKGELDYLGPSSPPAAAPAPAAGGGK